MRITAAFRVVSELTFTHFSFCTAIFRPPSLLLTVTGVVAHHTPGSLSALPPSNAPVSSTKKRGGNPADGSDPSVPMSSLGQAFSQNFVLVHQEHRDSGIASSHTQDGQTMTGRFFVQADTFRFVG